jgi:hypothetical protein
VNWPRKWKAFNDLQYHVTLSGSHFSVLGEASFWLLHHGTLNSSIPATTHSCYSSHSSLLPPEPITFAPQHTDVQCKNGPFHDRSPLPFLVASPRPHLLPLPPPKATTINSVAASFPHTTYNQQVLSSPAIIAKRNRAILPWLVNDMVAMAAFRASFSPIWSSFDEPILYSGFYLHE